MILLTWSHSHSFVHNNRKKKRNISRNHKYGIFSVDHLHFETDCTILKMFYYKILFTIKSKVIHKQNDKL